MRGKRKVKIRRFVAQTLNAGIFASLCLLLALAALPVTPGWWGVEAFVQCGVLLLAGVACGEAALSGVWRVPNRQLLWPLLGLVIYAFVQSGLALSADPFATRVAAVQLLALTLFLGLLLRYTDSAARLRTLGYLILGVGFTSACYGLLDESALTEMNQEAALVSYGQFANRNHFAFLMELTLGLALGLLTLKAALRRRALFLLAAVPMFPALVQVNSRGGILSLVLQFVVWLVLWLVLLWPLKRRRFLWLLALSLSLACLLVLLLGGEALWKRLETIPGELRAEQGDKRGAIRRREIWLGSWALSKEHWALGVGFGGYPATINQYLDAAGRWRPEQAHNDYLELLASGGVLAVLLTCWFVLVLVRRLWAGMHSASQFQRAASLGAAVGLSGVAAHSLVDFGLHILTNALVLTALAALAAVRLEFRVKRDARPPKGQYQ